MSTLNRLHLRAKKAEGKADMKNLLGGKGANLAEMCLLVCLFLPDSPSPQRFAPNIMKTTASSGRIDARGLDRHEKDGRNHGHEIW